MDCDVLTLSGLWDSGSQHWQTLWERKHPEFKRVAHRDWNNPVCSEWVNELDAAIADCEGAPILVAHSLSCMLTAHWARSGSDLKIAGAFLVAPSDVEAASFPVDPNGFVPIPLQVLPFPSIVIASTNDPFLSVERGKQFAQAWGSKYVEIGEAGHVNGESGYGEWPEGEKMLLDFCAQLKKG
ncbi:MAG: alpha/beta hydrolase [Pseudomonadota bacterium]